METIGEIMTDLFEDISIARHNLSCILEAAKLSRKIEEEGKEEVRKFGIDTKKGEFYKNGNDITIIVSKHGGSIECTNDDMTERADRNYDNTIFLFERYHHL